MATLGGNMARKKYLAPSSQGMVGDIIIGKLIIRLDQLIGKLITRLDQFNSLLQLISRAS